jgi:hypothetical protein
VEHWLPIKPVSGPSSKNQDRFVRSYSLGSKAIFIDSLKLTLLGLADMQSGSLILCRWRRRIRVSSEYVLTSEI